MLRWLPGFRRATKAHATRKGASEEGKSALGFLPHSDLANASFCISFPLFTSVTVVVTHSGTLAMAGINFAAFDIQHLYLHYAVGEKNEGG